MKIKLYFGLFLFLVPLFSFSQIYITEAMYNPKGNDKDREWIEMINLGNDIEVKSGKSGWRIFDGKNYRVLKGDNFVWKKNEIVLFVRNKNTILSEYNNLPNVKLVESSFSLNNKGATIRITDENKRTLGEFTYTSSIGGNGNGYSLIYDNGVIKEGKIKGGTPGIYPEPIFANEIGENKKPETNNLNTTNINKGVEIATTNKEEIPQDIFKENKNENLSSTNTENTKNEDYKNFEEKKVYLTITEFLPNPKGKDEEEFIEIYNQEDFKQKLDNVILVVGDKKIKLKGEINPGEYKAFYKKDLNFNIRNKGEEISLMDSEGNEIFYIKYEGKAPEGLSFSRDEFGKWHWTIPTPNRANIISKIIEEDKNKINSKEKTDNENTTSAIYDRNLIPEQFQNKNNLTNIYKSNDIKVILLGVLFSLVLAIFIFLFFK